MNKSFGAELANATHPVFASRSGVQQLCSADSREDQGVTNLQISLFVCVFDCLCRWGLIKDAH